MNSSSNQRLGWHWLWFFPLCVAVLLLVERHTVVYGFEIFKLGYKRWVWGGLLSPSTAFCLAVVAGSVVWPLLGLFFIALLVKYANELKAGQRWLCAVVLVAAIFLVPFVAEFLIWGSFPFVIDDQGVSRLRLIPFIPWPWGRYGEY